MSGVCSGSVLMLGIRMNSFNSASRRSRLSFTKASISEDMVFERPLYGGHRRPHAGTAGACVIQKGPPPRLVKRLCDQVVRPYVQGFGPEPCVGVRIGHNHFKFLRAFAGEAEGVAPGSIGEGGFGQDNVVFVLPKLGARVLQRSGVVYRHRKRTQHLRDLTGIIAMSGNE